MRLNGLTGFNAINHGRHAAAEVVEAGTRQVFHVMGEER